jgi:hypothetical protein
MSCWRCALHSTAAVWPGSAGDGMLRPHPVHPVPPSFVYLVLWTYTPQRRPVLLRYWTLTFTAIAFAGIISAPLVMKMRRFYVPLGFSNEKYALFSPNHLTDIVNELFMLLPILPVVAAMAWIGRNAERASGRDATRDARALKAPTEWFTHPAEWQLVSTILIPCAFYIASGMALGPLHHDRDGAGAVPAANRPARPELPAAKVAGFAVPSLLVMLISSAAWVGVNASTERTMARFQSILTYDRTHAAYAWETLAMLQHDRKELDAAIATMRIAYDHSHNPRQGARLAVYLDEAGHTDEAKQVIEKILEKHPESTVARFRLLMFLEKEDNWTAILNVARDGVKYTPDDGVYYFFYGEALLRAGDIKNGVEMFRKSQEFKLPADITTHVDEVLKQYGGGAAPLQPPAKVPGK